MSKVAQYLQEHLLGEVTSSAAVRKHFAHDGSILQVMPSVVVYPRNESDVRKTARFAWQLAERGRKLPITARGAGTDLSGAAIGSGLVLVFPAYMNRVLVLDNKTGSVAVEPGINYGKLQQTLQTYHRFLPPYPASAEYSTVGGAIANNASGEKSVKYGDTLQYVRSLRVVLANGEVIETGRISKRELSKKLGLATFEGEIYRSVDSLLEEHADVIAQAGRSVAVNTAGYNLAAVKRKDGSIDLTPLFVGSQGTLGIITEAVLSTELDNPHTTLFAGFFDDVQHLSSAVNELRKLPERPSALEMIDDSLLRMLEKLNPAQLKSVISKPLPKAVLLVEFDTANQRAHKRLTKRAEKILQQYAADWRRETDPVEQDKLWSLRYASATIISHAEGNLRALPFVEDGAVPTDKLAEYLEATYELFRKHQLTAALWGRVGDGSLRLQPFLDLGQIGDRQKLFRLADEYYALLVKLGGTTSGSHGDGRLRARYLPQLYGKDMYNVLAKLKVAFDPHNILNPGVKFGSSADDVKAMLRPEYTLGHLYSHLPRT